MAVVIENGRYTGCHLNNSTDPRPIPAECSWTNVMLLCKKIGKRKQATIDVISSCEENAGIKS